MLPYKLRAPVFGSVEENKRRKADATSFAELSMQGGPVQKAIVQDLLLFQQRSVTKIIGLLDNIDLAGGHFHQGAIFRRFQKEFGASKIALLHILLPHPRCDTEAYAQLIYAAALQCFQQAMEQLSDVQQDGMNDDTSQEDKDSQRLLLLLHAIVAIFTLYSLFETNPLLRADSLAPAQWLPVGMQNRENSRALYRRAFRQPIRIDAHCFSLVVQLGQWCLMEKAQCQRDVQKHQLQQKATTEGSATAARRRNCTCGMAGDTVVVLQRLFAHWEFCDYTGPVGLEALAGHQEYTDISTGVCESVPTMPMEYLEQPLPIAVPPQEELDIVTSNKDVASALKEYAEILEAATKGIIVRPTSARVPKWQQVLVSTLSSNEKQPWSDILTRNVLREQDSVESAALRPPMEARDDTMSQKKDSVNLKEDDSEKIPDQDASTGMNVDDLPSPVSLSTEVTSVMKQNLTNIFQLIQQREGPQFFHQTHQASVSVSNNKLEEEDVSTLGFGGVSVATGQGKAALEALLSSVALPNVPNQVLPSNRKRDSERLPAVPSSAIARVERFLQGNESSEDQETDSEASVMSNLSESEGEDNQEEETSVATSAAGKQALEALLSRVSGGAKMKRSRVRQPKNADAGITKRKPVTKKQGISQENDVKAVDMDAELGSTATASMGPGEHALRSLLQMSTAIGRPEPQVSTASQRNSKQNYAKAEDPGIDAVSVATSSVGPGEHALHNLLQMSARHPPDSTKSHPKPGKGSVERGQKKTSKRERHRGVPTEPVKRQKGLSSEQSVGSSVGGGEHALKILLGRLDEKTNTKNASADDEASSVTSSSIGGGQQALHALLSKGRTI